MRLSPGTKPILVALCALILATLACGSPATQRKAAAERIGEQLGKKLINGKDDAQIAGEGCLNLRIQSGIDLFTQCYGNEFRAAVDLDEWKQTLHDMERVTGTLVSYELTDWGTQMVSDGDDDIIVVVQLLFTTQYEKHDAVELIWMAQESPNGRFLIRSHQIQSDAFDPSTPPSL